MASLLNLSPVNTKTRLTVTSRSGRLCASRALPVGEHKEKRDMHDNVIPFPIAEESELEEPDWEHLIAELQRAHKFMGRYDPPGNIDADIPAFALVNLTQFEPV